MGLEFFSRSLEEYNKSFEQLNSSFDRIDDITRTLFKENAEQIRLAQQHHELLSKIENAYNNEFFYPSANKDKILARLEALREKCIKAVSQQEIDSIGVEYRTIMQSRMDTALEQRGINAKAGILSKVSSDIPKGIETDVVQGKNVSQNSKVITPVVKKLSPDEIMQEAAKRSKQEALSNERAQKAQKYFSSLSDMSTGKSAKESAEFFKAAGEAAERAKQKAISEENAQKAQKYFFSLSDMSTGKSAKESAEFFKAAGEAAERAKQKAISEENAQKAQKYFSSLSDMTTGKSTEKSAEFFKKQQTISYKIKQFIKEKITPTVKTKQFKIIATAITVIAASLLSLKIINSAKTNDSENINKVI